MGVGNLLGNTPEGTGYVPVRGYKEGVVGAIGGATPGNATRFEEDDEESTDSGIKRDEATTPRPMSPTSEGPLLWITPQQMLELERQHGKEMMDRLKSFYRIRDPNIGVLPGDLLNSLSKDSISLASCDANLNRYTWNGPVDANPAGIIGSFVLGGYLGLSETGRVFSYPLRWVGVDFSAQDRALDQLWEDLRAPEGTREQSQLAAKVSATAATSAIALPPVQVTGRVIYLRVMSLGATGSRQVYVVGTLTATQVQALIQSSGDRGVTLFARLSQSPAANRIMYTSTNPNLCNQIQTNAGKTQMYSGKIPYDLFHRLRLEGLIRDEQTQMGIVVDKAYLIEAEAMAILQHYFQMIGGDGLP
jgi:hypothetical protein